MVDTKDDTRIEKAYNWYMNSDGKPVEVAIDGQKAYIKEGVREGELVAKDGASIDALLTNYGFQPLEADVDGYCIVETSSGPWKVKHINGVLTGYPHLSHTTGGELKPLSEENLISDILSLSTSRYTCTRVWEAWQYGTMTQEDFIPLDEDETYYDKVKELVSEYGTAPVDKETVRKECLQDIASVLWKRIDQAKANGCTLLETGALEVIKTLMNPEAPLTAGITKKRLSQRDAVLDEAIEAINKIPYNCTDCGCISDEVIESLEQLKSKKVDTTKPL